MACVASMRQRCFHATQNQCSRDVHVQLCITSQHASWACIRQCAWTGTGSLMPARFECHGSLPMQAWAAPCTDCLMHAMRALQRRKCQLRHHPPVSSRVWQAWHGIHDACSALHCMGPLYAKQISLTRRVMVLFGARAAWCATWAAARSWRAAASAPPITHGGHALSSPCSPTSVVCLRSML